MDTSDASTLSPVQVVSPSGSCLQFHLHKLVQIVDSTTRTELNFHATSDEQECLDAMEVQILAGLTALRNRRNRLCAINRLPDEILLMIFLLCQNEESPWEMLRYLHLTWICRHWRLLVVSHAEFWTLFDLMYRAKERNGVMIELVRRSKGAKLSVAQLGRRSRRHYNEEEELRLFQEFIAPEFWRLGSLEIHMSTKGWEDILSQMQQAAPFLRRCHLSTTTTHINGCTCQICFKDVIIPNLFSGLAQLRELRLQNVHTPWDMLATMTQGLRELKLRVANSDANPARPTKGQILHVIEACPELEILDLETHLLIPSAAAGSVSPTLPFLAMPRLSHIYIRSSNDTSVLRHISTPVLRQLHIQFDGNVPATLLKDIARYVDLSALQAASIGPVNVEPLGLQLSFRGTYQDCNSSNVHSMLSATERIPLCIMCSEDAPLGNLFLSLMVKATSISTLAIHCGIFGKSHFELHQQILRHADSVRNLTISNYSGRPAVYFLEQLADPSVCPKLKSFTYGGGQDRAAPGKLLVSLVKARRNGGATLVKRIKLVRCPRLQKIYTRQLEKLGVDLQD